MAKQNTTIWIVAIVVLGFLAVFGLATDFQFSTVGQTEGDEDVTPDWSGRDVPVELRLKDMYDSAATVNATVKVYESQPEDWEDALGDFDDDSEYELAELADGDADVLEYKDTPGTYYAVIQAPGYNTEFDSFEIPSYDDIGESLSDYSRSDNLISHEFDVSQVGTAESAPSDIDFSLSNESNVELDEEVDIEIAEDTEFRSWKVVVSDEIEFSYNADDDDVYDEGINKFEFDFMDETFEVFDSDENIIEFDTRDNFEAMVDDVIAEEEDVEMDFRFEADETGDYAGSNDEVLGEGDGTIATVTVYGIGAEGSTTTLGQFDIVA